MIALLFSQLDALTEEIDGRIAHEGAVEFVKPVALFVFLPSCRLLVGMARCRNPCLALSYINRKFGDGLVDESQA